MNPISDEQIAAYVENNIGTFHGKRIDALNKLKLPDLLRRKNPYLFKSKNITVASDLIRSLLDAYLSSQEETLFGDFLEGLAIYVAETVHGGWKSSATGIDLEFAHRYGAVVNRLSVQFSEGFCAEDGSIDWRKLVAFNSAKMPPPNLK